MLTVSETIQRTYRAFEKSGKKNPSKREVWAFILSAYRLNEAEYKELCESLGINEHE